MVFGRVSFGAANAYFEPEMCQGTLRTASHEPRVTVGACYRARQAQ